MSRVGTFGMIYTNRKYLDAINSFFYPVEKMIESAAAIKTNTDADPDQYAWGRFQQYFFGLTTAGQMSTDALLYWQASVKLGREDLASQPNTEPVCSGDTNVPADRCALLDAALTKCFTTPAPGRSEPGIPIVVNVRQKAASDFSPTRHEVSISWTYDPATSKPLQLNYTILCPSSPALQKGSVGA